MSKCQNSANKAKNNPNDLICKRFMIEVEKIQFKGDGKHGYQFSKRKRSRI